MATNQRGGHGRSDDPDWLQINTRRDEKERASVCVWVWPGEQQIFV